MDSDFESNVNTVVKLFAQDYQWFNGTLFVTCGENAARHIWHVLCEQFGLEHVRISKVGPEYAYDFV